MTPWYHLDRLLMTRELNPSQIACHLIFVLQSRLFTNLFYQIRPKLAGKSRGRFSAPLQIILVWNIQNRTEGLLNVSRRISALKFC